MARTKNREYQQVLSPAYTFSRRWKMGGYIRLSKEDLKKALNGKDDSNSVKNSGTCSMTSTANIRRNLKASLNMWMTATPGQIRTGRRSNNFWPT